MSHHCAHCNRRLTVDEVNYLGYACEKCERKHMRRWDDQYRAHPTKFTQRLAIVMAIAVIFACVVVIKKLGGG